MLASCAFSAGEPGAETERPEEYEDAYFEFEPGVVIVALKEPYTGPLGEYFPEIKIASSEDVNRARFIVANGNPDTKEQAEQYKSLIGTEFLIRLEQETDDAVIEAVEKLATHPNVKYVQPNYITGSDGQNSYKSGNTLPFTWAETPLVLKNGSGTLDLYYSLKYSERYDEKLGGFISATGSPVDLENVLGMIPDVSLSDGYSLYAAENATITAINVYRGLSFENRAVTFIHTVENGTLLKDLDVFTGEGFGPEGYNLVEAFVTVTGPHNEAAGRNEHLTASCLFILNYTGQPVPTHAPTPVPEGWEPEPTPSPPITPP